MDPDLKKVGLEPGKQHAQYSSYDRRTRNSRQCPFSPAKIATLIVSLIIATSVVVKTWHRPNSRSLPEGVERWQGWKSEPVGTVMWTPCRGDDDLLHAECGYAVVPKDYHNPLNGTVKIAISRYNATTQPSKGTLLFSPGGPGARGKALVAQDGHLLQALVGEDYDIVGFDPRGVRESEPILRCFESRRQSHMNTNMPYYSHGTFLHNTVLDLGYDFPLNVTPAELREIILPQQILAQAMHKTEAEACKLVHGHDLDHFGTTLVARDLEAIVTQLDGPESQINFFGDSYYGSILGQYLINMFPERIGRVVLTSVTSAGKWSKEPSHHLYLDWLTAAEDSYHLFFEKCFDAGPQICQLAKAEDESPLAIQQRLEGFINELYYAPLPVPRAMNPTILTAGQVWKYLWKLLKRPDLWEGETYQLAQAINGDATSIINGLDFSTWYYELEGAIVHCNDVAPVVYPSVEGLVDEHLDTFYNVSKFVFAAMTSELDSACQYWDLSPVDRFSGPWNHNLSNPILITANMADAMSSHSATAALAKQFGNSSYLTYEMPGHSVAVSSQCIANHIRTYLANGTLPPEDTSCPPEWQLFQGPSGDDDDDDDEVFYARARRGTFRDLHSALLRSRLGYLSIS